MNGHGQIFSQGVGTYADKVSEKLHVGPETAAVEMGPFTMAGMTFEEVHGLVRRIQVLADRLSGPLPQQAGDPKPPIDHKPPLFAALRMEANRAASAVREAHDALERIERHLS